MKIKFKKIIITLLLAFMVLANFNFVFSANTAEKQNKKTDLPFISADAFIVLDNKTNKILYNKNETKKMYPASTTKILTALLTLENCELDDIVTANYNAISVIPEGYSTANIQANEKLTVEQLLNLLLIPSANDAANVLAEHVGGSIDNFISMMNKKLEELGLKNSHFTNAFGMHDDDHYTTAEDLAKIMQYCLKYDHFKEIASKAKCTIPATNKSAARTYTSTNELILPNYKNYYEYITAGKTGTTTQAKQCLVTSAFRDDLELICVILGSEKRFVDAKNLYEYTYSNYSIKNIVNEKDSVTSIEVEGATSETKNLDLLVNETIPVLINNSTSISEIEPNIKLNEKISAPIEEGTVLGTVTYKVEGVEYTSNLVASHFVEKSKLLLYVLIAVVAIIFLFILCMIIAKNKKRKSRYTY